MSTPSRGRFFPDTCKLEAARDTPLWGLSSVQHLLLLTLYSHETNTPAQDRSQLGVAVDGWRALRMLAVERNTTINALAIEAFNDLLKKYGKRQSVENPLLDD